MFVIVGSCINSALISIINYTDKEVNCNSYICYPKQSAVTFSTIFSMECVSIDTNLFTSSSTVFCYFYARQFIQSRLVPKFTPKGFQLHRKALSEKSLQKPVRNRSKNQLKKCPSKFENLQIP